VLGDGNIFLGYLPSTPDNVTALFEYGGSRPIYSFGNINEVYNVQLRVRDLFPVDAYEQITYLDNIINRYSDGEVSIIRTTAILDIGKDNHNPQRHEYTANYKVINLN
jgi:hypothetical protein